MIWQKPRQCWKRCSNVVRGDIYRFRPNDVRGRKQSGARFAVVIQSDDLMLSTLLVAPTSTSARPTVFRPQIELGGQPTLVLLEQVTVVNPETELGDFAGRLLPEELAVVDQALVLVMGLF
ncbi:MAG: type II toxin-antitoxin system PemK/MazF family toxin [Micrococcales bacterium]|nr:type II toxin-antitoxin system PemK/MazF family toxin [Micrococcales bacterium]